MAKSHSCFNVDPVTPPVQHAEGPFWDEETDVLCYVDTFTATVYRWRYNDNSLTSFKLEDRDSVGVLIAIKDKPDEYIIGADRYLYKFIWNENVKSTPHLQELLMIESNKPHNQYNDGKVDNKGRLWMGTLTRNRDLSVKPNGGSLYMIRGECSMDFEEKVSHTSISNGLAWSRDDKNLYHIDSSTRTVVGYEFDENSGSLGNKRVVFDLHDHPNLKGIPDGMTIDDDDNLWIALFGGHSVINVDPRTGSLKRVINIPATYVTSACFGGCQLDVLYVTTSKLHLNEVQLKEEPFAGSVFAVSNLGVRGLPSNKFVLS